MTSRTLLLVIALFPLCGQVFAQTVYPIDRAAILVGSQFDFKVEGPADIPASDLSVTINGMPPDQVFGRAPVVIEREDGKDQAALMLRGASIIRPGRYVVEVHAGRESRRVTWEVYDTTGKRVAKNVILFIGDGLSMGHRTAARMLSRGISEGRYNGKLEIDQMPHMALVSTAGVDTIITDSANSASAYTTGHKSNNNALGVYGDRTASTTDDPRVETLTSLAQRRAGMAVGVVTNTEIQDATPAAMVAHTRRRSEFELILDQFFDAKPDVIMGGGAAHFLPKSTPGSKRSDEKNYIEMFKNAGYSFAGTATELKSAASADSTRQLLGLFNLGNMDGALDRRILKRGTVEKFPDQPDLTDQVRAALAVLSRHREGFVLLVESGMIDKYTHALDWERAVFDTIMFDNAVKVAKDFAAPRKDTLILALADHSHPISIIGTIDNKREAEQTRDKIGIYEAAGYPIYPAPDEDNYPPTVDVAKRLVMGFGAFPDYYETYKPKLDGPNVPAIVNEDKIAEANEKYKDVKGAVLRTGNLPRTASQGVHAADDIVLTAIGPGSEQVQGQLENVEIFRIIATALALGKR